MIKSVCVFCSSSDAVAPVFFDLARSLGSLLAARDVELIYGGTTVGLMGALAAAVKAGGGRVTGVIPESIERHGIGNGQADRLIVAKSLRERKQIMEEYADAFIALPGGIGTLEEVLEILTLKQLGVLTKPVAFLDTAGYFGPLFTFFEKMVSGNFLKAESHLLYHISESAEGVFTYFDRYAPVPVNHKWFKPRPEV